MFFDLCCVPRASVPVRFLVLLFRQSEDDHCRKFRVRAVYWLVFLADPRGLGVVHLFSPEFWNISSVSEWLSESAVLGCSSSALACTLWRMVNTVL